MDYIITLTGSRRFRHKIYGVLSFEIVSTPAFAEASAGMPSASIKDWLGIAQPFVLKIILKTKGLDFPEFTSFFNLGFPRKLPVTAGRSTTELPRNIFLRKEQNHNMHRPVVEY